MYIKKHISKILPDGDILKDGDKHFISVLDPMILSLI